jgi:hypothetical protein
LSCAIAGGTDFLFVTAACVTFIFSIRLFPAAVAYRTPNRFLAIASFATHLSPFLLCRAITRMDRSSRSLAYDHCRPFFLIYLSLSWFRKRFLAGVTRHHVNYK